MAANNAINNTLQTPFNVGATSVTSTGTQLNYLNALTAVPINKMSVQRVTASGAGTYTPTAGMKYVIVCAQAAGGGAGGAANAAATQFAFGAGGGGGEYIEALFAASDIGASKAYSVGAKGTGGTAGANNGTAGGNTTFNTTWIAATGGGAGTGGASAAASQLFQAESNINNGGAGGSVSTGSLVKQVSGSSGQFAFALVATGLSSGGGRAGIGSPGGLNKAATSAAGANGSAGSGGSGGLSYNAGGAFAGGDGGDGSITFIEFLSA